MDIKKLQGIIIDALEDVKAADIALFDTSKMTGMFDRLIIASGTSNRQTKALAASVRDKVRQAGGEVVGMEGEETGEWVLVDVGDIVVHIMQPPIRAYYQLEEIWGEKPIDVEKAKAAAQKPATRRKTAAASEAKTAKPAKQPPAAKKTAAKTTGKAASTAKAATKARATCAPAAASKKTPAQKPADNA
ncbi:MAG: ribosome silencing factor [Alistipes senegalensis]|nr:ribosome silencing factor [Oxalobacter formigenes]MCM1281247.1 ribosome silencing factor [Alistipes senegalensis]